MTLSMDDFLFIFCDLGVGGQIGQIVICMSNTKKKDLATTLSLVPCKFTILNTVGTGTIACTVQCTGVWGYGQWWSQRWVQRLETPPPTPSPWLMVGRRKEEEGEGEPPSSPFWLRHWVS
jgi:hypothetical protein